MNKSKKNENFIEKAKQVHNGKYDYSKVEYVNNKTKVCIICPEHGEFWQTPNSHLMGCGCKKCGYIFNSKNNSMGLNTFIEKAKQVHADKYDYSKIKYINNYTKVCIICPVHGEFWQTPFAHLQGQGCPNCKGKKISSKKVKTQKKFIDELKQIHGDKYNYSKVEYNGCYDKVCISCSKHGEFWMTPNNLLNGHGCPFCSNSLLEVKVNAFLNSKKINFIPQCRKDVLPWLDKQSLDFYLPKYNIAIECQGRQHFIPIDFFGGEDAFEYRKKLDKNKYDLCQKNNVKLFYINYNDNLENKLKELVNICSG